MDGSAGCSHHRRGRPRADRGRRTSSRGRASGLRALTAFPERVWRQSWSNKPQQHAHQKIRCRAMSSQYVPDRNALIDLVGAMLPNNTTNGPNPAATCGWTS
jgi:transposase-like protein